MRIWKFTPTGCIVTTPIDYLDSPGDLVRFARAPASSGPRGTGLSVGEGRLFTEYQDAGQYDDALEHVSKVYADPADNQHWLDRKGPAGYFILKFGKGDLVDPDQLDEGGKSKATEYVIFKKTLHHVASMFSRGTKCYLAIAKPDIESPGFALHSPQEIIPRLRLLKTSWQHVARTPEAQFFREYNKRHRHTTGERPCGIAALLASGTVTTQNEIRWMSAGNGWTVAHKSKEPKDDIEE
ncbi:SubName: Full=Uncharacterized protein {ECO:0000313/EMBL:CCA76719.1} [Serendipita indica DSM 11827]|uniref:Uncharacterized protein n=1 Tax=Serendipita indica (strain DSM 11827) TaxID=1109443 RepID=G4TZH6_SERID|nr:SubName: Full=Uncharacterized protein {ECO:0000313/EMBL:CCA76719.1} [Serendipita indica DSM 11827]CCA76719.1 hypothetical protein PIIN_10707 [Serendipita indica DSM 11827]